jgi:hypothetical protein
MNKIDMIKFLVKEIEYVVECFEGRKQDIETARIKAMEKGSREYWKFIEYRYPQQQKQIVYDNMKKIRKLALEISEEVKNNG